FFFFSSRRRHTRSKRDWSSDVCSSDLLMVKLGEDMYAIPLNQIEGIVRVSPYELEEYFVADPPPFTYANQQYDFEYLGQLVQGQIGRASCRESVKGREGEGEAKREERD